MANEHLIIVGTGIRSVGQITIETMAWIQRAEQIFHAIDDPVGTSIVQTLNPNAKQTSLLTLYAHGVRRKQSYEKMVMVMLDSVRAGYMTVGVFYGHPGVMAFPPHEVIRRARSEGFRARMLPGVSAEDCLYADLGIDIGEKGCVSFEATDFLLRDRYIDPNIPLILWQIGVIGNQTFQKDGYSLLTLPLLKEKLLRWYPPFHSAVIYEAALIFDCEPRMQTMNLEDLTAEMFTWRSTLFIPAMGASPYDDTVYSRYKVLNNHQSNNAE